MMPIAGFFTTQTIGNDEVLLNKFSCADISNRDSACAVAPDCVREGYYNEQHIFSDLNVKAFKEDPVPEDFVLYI